TWPYTSLFRSCLKIRQPEIGQIPLAAQVEALALVLVAEAQGVEEDGPPGFEPAPEPVALVPGFDRLDLHAPPPIQPLLAPHPPPLGEGGVDVRQECASHLAPPWCVSVRVCHHGNDNPSLFQQLPQPL